MVLQEYERMHHIQKLDELLYCYLPSLPLSSEQRFGLASRIKSLYVDVLTDAYVTGNDHGYDKGWDNREKQINNA